MNANFWFYTGIVLLIVNAPIGWSGVILFTYLAKKSGKKKYYAFATAIYAFSWGLLAAGAALAGPKGVALVKQYGKMYPIIYYIGVAGILAIPISIWLMHRNKNKDDNKNKP